MAFDSLRSWLGLGPASDDAAGSAPLRELIETLDHLEPSRARHLARFAYLLGRVAHADQHVSPEESGAIERILVQEGSLSPDQAIVVAGLARASNLMFGSTADFQVAREFAASATYDEKFALVGCLFAVAAVDAAISVTEESEIHRIATHFKILPHDLTALRVAHAQSLPGVIRRQG
jgi:uncharacterized tellurite resistance protein B-like protein